MELTEDMIYGLNNMNVYAQRARLGDIIQGLIDGGGGGGTGDTSLIEGSTTADFPVVGDSQNLYISTEDNTIYRWDDTDGEYHMVGSNTDTVISEIKFIDGGKANG